MRNYTIVGLLLAAPLGWAQAQYPATVQDGTAGKAQSVYATSSIELLPGFSTSSEIEIDIRLPLSTLGQWSASIPFAVDNEPFIGIHTHVLPDGNVMLWQGHNDSRYHDSLTTSPHRGTHIYRWSPVTGDFVSPTPMFMLDWTNAFCTGHTFLADGRLLVTGGHDRNVPATSTTGAYALGLPHASLYDYRADQDATQPGSTNPVSWSRQQDMIRNRWYPTSTTLTNGDVLCLAGETEPNLPDSQKYPELWRNGTWVTLNSAAQGLPYYPWMFQTHNGQVFYAGPGTNSQYLNPYANNMQGQWTNVSLPARYQYFRGQGTASMYRPGKILLVGGSDGSTVTNTAEMIELGSYGSTTVPSSQLAASMQNSRHHVNSTILPDGTVLVTGGSRIPSARDAGMGVLEAELWNPPPPAGTGAAPGGTWTTLAAMKEARMYHSTAALLPDGRVLSAGGEEVISYYPSFVPNVDNHCTAEIYSPPYLFKGTRPLLSSTPAHVGYGQAFTVLASPNGGTAINRVTMVRLSSVTHSFNMNQRFLEVAVNSVGTGSAAGSVSVTAPAHPEECPPGHYLLFALNASGVPSVGQVVAIGPNPCAAAPQLATTYASNGACAGYVTARVSGPSLQGDYKWTINGYYDASYDGQSAVTISIDRYAPQVTFGVSATPTCGGDRLENFASYTRTYIPSKCP